MKSPEFIVYAYPWDDEVGGFMVLHALCARLTELGYSAAIWPSWRPVGVPRDWATLRKWLGYLARGRFLRKFDTGTYDPEVARGRDRKRAIVVYPEIVAGNPLGARKVVRWLLYHPGAHTGRLDFGPDDLVMLYNQAFADPRVAQASDQLLRVIHQSPVYRQWNFAERSGSCVVVRKGWNRTLDQHPPDAIPVDDVSHEQRATVFNQVRYCYCYDLYTYYSVYAALCGCTPVIIPEPGLSEQDWEPDERHRLGLAYGTDRIAWAEQTREDLRRYVAERRLQEDETVRRFVEIARHKPGW